MLTKKVANRLTFITLDLWPLKKVANGNNINNVNPLCLMINETIGHFEKSKYLVLDDVDENKEVSKK